MNTFKRLMLTGVWCVCALLTGASGLQPALAAPAGASCAGRLGLSADCPIPLRFTRGSYGVLVSGTLTRIPDQRFYSIRARAGQRMTITFTGLAAMRGGINFPGGSGDGPFYGEGNSITLPTTGVYVLYVGQNTMAGDPWRGPFTLAVLVR